MLPSKCDACQSPDVFLTHKAPKGNDYYSIKCKVCGAELHLHQKKEGGFFLKQDEKMTVYTGTPKEQANQDSECP